MEGPQTVPKVVVGCGEHKADGVGNVLVPSELLLAQPCGAKIDQHTRKAHNAELQKFEYQCAVNHGL